MLPAIVAAIPALIGLADKLFSPKPPGEKVGDAKKAFVMGALDKAWDAWGQGVFPDIPGFDEKAWFLGCASVTIDQIVAALKAPKE